MELTPVESSHIAAIGYLEAERVLLVRFKDSAVAAWPNIHPFAFGHLDRATSKGIALREITDDRAGIPITKGVMPTDAGPSATELPVNEPGGNEAPSPGPLNVIDEDAGECCRTDISAALETDAIKKYVGGDGGAGLKCRKCETEFRAEMVGSIRHWLIVEHIAVVRPR